jgi:dTDP-4-amino-4,6-dideoxygalactose transaminase
MNAISPSDQYYQIPLPTVIKVPLLVPWWTTGDLWTAVNAILIGETQKRELSDLSQHMFGAKYVIATGRASSALMLGLKALGYGQGDEVIIQSMICRSVVQGIVNAGCTPVLADVGDDYNLDPAKIEECISPSTKAIVIANMFGKLADIDAIQAVARRHNVFLIDDAAVSGGASSNGKMSGTFGNFGIISFNFGKNMIAGGGGLLLTDSEEMYEKAKSISLNSVSRMRMWRDLVYMNVYHRYKKQVAPMAKLLREIRREKEIPMNEAYGATVPRIELDDISPISCALALRQMRLLPEIVERCRKHAQILSEMLARVEEISLPSGAFPEHVFTYYAITLRAGSRFELGQYLRVKGIETKWSYFPLHLQEAYHHYRRGNLENTERLWPRLLYLPADASVSESQVISVGRAVRDYYERSKSKQ